MIYSRVRRFFKEKSFSQALLIFWTIAFSVPIFLITEGSFNAIFFLNIVCIILLGLSLSFYQWYHRHSNVSLEENYLLLNSPFKESKIAFNHIDSFIGNLELNTFLIKTIEGKTFSIAFDNYTYRRFCAEILKESSHKERILSFPQKISFSKRYLITFLMIICLPPALILFIFYQKYFFLGIFTFCLFFTFMIASSWRYLRGIPLFYLFQEDQIVLKFFFKKKIAIDLKQVDRMILTLDKSHFCHCTFLLRDSSFYEISEMFSSRSFYLVLLRIKQSLNFSINS